MCNQKVLLKSSLVLSSDKFIENMENFVIVYEILYQLGIFILLPVFWPKEFSWTMTQGISKWYSQNGDSQWLKIIMIIKQDTIPKITMIVFWMIEIITFFFFLSSQLFFPCSAKNINLKNALLQFFSIQFIFSSRLLFSDISFHH